MAVLKGCRQTGGEWHSIAPGKPNQNGFVESRRIDRSDQIFAQAGLARGGGLTTKDGRRLKGHTRQRGRIVRLEACHDCQKCRDVQGQRQAPQLVAGLTRGNSPLSLTRLADVKDDTGARK